MEVSKNVANQDSAQAPTFIMALAMLIPSPKIEMLYQRLVFFLNRRVCPVQIMPAVGRALGSCGSLY